MGQPYVGEIRMFAGNFAPAGWAFCQGQTMAISENETLFQLIGTTYGGDGQNTFNLPNLSSRVPLHMGTGAGLSNYVIGETAGVEQVTLTTNQIPSHTHTPLAAGVDATASVGTNGLILANMGPAGQTQIFTYGPNDSANQVQLNNNTITPVGGSQPHENLQPLLVINFIISLFGVFPSPT
ncbi:MAG TPA: tail fiber protein [Allosphingosinicella sp.]|nr:tail fiber protein [Allosphingosinicella sp.]